MTKQTKKDSIIETKNEPTEAELKEMKIRQRDQHEFSALKYAVEDLKDLTEAITARMKCLRLLYDDETKSLEPYLSMDQEKRDIVFESVYALDRLHLKELSEEITIADRSLGKIMKLLNK